MLIVVYKKTTITTLLIEAAYITISLRYYTSFWYGRLGKVYPNQ